MRVFQRYLHMFCRTGESTWLESRDVTRLMAPGARRKFGAPMFEPEVFQKQMNCIEGSTWDIVGTFRRPSQWFGTRGIVTPFPPLIFTTLLGSSWKVLNSIAGVRGWRPPGSGGQVTVYLLRRLCLLTEALNHNRSQGCCFFIRVCAVTVPLHHVCDFDRATVESTRMSLLEAESNVCFLRTICYCFHPLDRV